MTKEEYTDLKDELTEVLIEIEGLKENLNILYRKKNVLMDRIAGYEASPSSTNIEYLCSRFDFELSDHWCSRATVTKAKKMLLDCGYTDLKQLEGKKFSDFFDLCDGTKQLGIVLAFCNKCNVKMNMESTSREIYERMKNVKDTAIRFMNYIIL